MNEHENAAESVRQWPLWHWFAPAETLRQEVPSWVTIPPIPQRLAVAANDLVGAARRRLQLMTSVVCDTLSAAGDSSGSQNGSDDSAASPSAGPQSPSPITVTSSALAQPATDAGTSTQPAASAHTPATLAASTATPDCAARPVAIGIPGIWESRHYLDPWARALADAGWDARILEGVRAMRRPIDTVAQMAERYLARENLTHVLLYSHSKGGLVAKAIMAGPEGWRIRHLITFATPFDGAPIARLLPIPSLRELSPGSPAIRPLASRTDLNARITQIEATWDENVPPTTLPGAHRRVILPIYGHGQMLESRGAARTLVQLAEPYRC